MNCFKLILALCSLSSVSPAFAHDSSRPAAQVASRPAVYWEMDPSSTWRNARFRFTVSNTDSIAQLLFCHQDRNITALNQGDKVDKILAGYYAVTSPRFGRNAEPVVIELAVSPGMLGAAEVPGSFHALTPGGRILQVASVGKPMLDMALENPTWTSWMVPADSLYRLNESLSSGNLPGPFDIIPSFKKVKLTKGTFKKGMDIKKKTIKNKNPEYYKITLTPKGAILEGASQTAIDRAARVLENQLLEPNGNELPCAVIEDWPDYPYRGMMVDISRNYLDPAEMKKLVDAFADYRLNKLHFHLIDDEGWRLEIPGLPELTEVGSRRGYTTDDASFLKQTYAGNGNPDSQGLENSGNGHFTRNEFIDFLKYCANLGIDVIPEIESPGHSRAAIKSMEARYRRTGDDTYRLIIDNDTSRYRTAQGYGDALMNPAAPGTYRFLSKVVDEIASMYKDAGVTLPGIHFGGDEVPDGAWDGCAQTVEWAAAMGLAGRHDIHGEFVRRVARMMTEKNIPMYGWQDIYTGYGNSHDEILVPITGGVNCWTTPYEPGKNVASLGVKRGYPVILSNVDYFYIDMIPTNHPQERGLHWGPPVDELKTFSGYPAKLVTGDAKGPGKIFGIQGQLWSETVRSNEGAERMIFPKLAGVAERAWNGNPTYSEADYNLLIGEKELPRLGRKGINRRLRQPGILVEGNTVKMNTPYPSAEIRYTFDGSVPSPSSPRYEGPIALPEGTRQVRAVLFHDGLQSVETVALTGK